MDIEQIVRNIEPLEHFIQDSELLNVATGVQASTSVNLDKTKFVGEQIPKDMGAKEIDKYVFRRNEKAVTMDEKSCGDRQRVRKCSTGSYFEVSSRSDQHQWF